MIRQVTLAGSMLLILVAALYHSDIASAHGTASGEDNPCLRRIGEQVVKMVRGEADTAVKLGVKGEGGLREIAITRIASEKLYKGAMEPHGGPMR